MACQLEVAEHAEVEPAVRKAAVVGGKEVSVCQFPSTVRVEGCTGTLIHPRVVTTAAHCLSGESASIRFGGGRNDPGSFALEGRCVSGARGQRGVGANSDWGYCVLPEDERLKQMPITPPLVGCEAKRFLKEGATGWIVGYGTTGPEGRGGGIKRAVEVKVNRVSNGTVDVGDREVGACHGDSGGPIYMQLTDGANDYGLRVFGSTSGPGAAFCDCTCSTLYVDIAMHIKAIEENEDIDVTPCTDAEGNWAPGPECNAIQTQAMNGSGTFPSCTVARTTAPINSCAADAATAAGSGGSPGAATAGRGPSAAAGSGGMSGGAAGAAGGMSSATAAGAAAPAADSGTTAPGMSGAAGVRAPDLGSAGVGVGMAGRSSAATGTTTLGVSTAGGPAIVPTQPVPTAGAGANEDEGGGCSVASARKRSDLYPALLYALCGLWIGSRARRRERRQSS